MQQNLMHRKSMQNEVKAQINGKLVDMGKRFNQDYSKVTRPFTIMVDLINELLNSGDSCSELYTSETSLTLLDFMN